MLITTSQF